MKRTRRCINAKFLHARCAGGCNEQPLAGPVHRHPGWLRRICNWISAVARLQASIARNRIQVDRTITGRQVQKILVWRGSNRHWRSGCSYWFTCAGNLSGRSGICGNRARVGTRHINNGVVGITGSDRTSGGAGRAGGRCCARSSCSTRRASGCGCAGSSGGAGRAGCPGRTSGRGCAGSSSGAGRAGRSRGGSGSGRRGAGAVVIFLALRYEETLASCQTQNHNRHANGNDPAPRATGQCMHLHRGMVHGSPLPGVYVAPLNVRPSLCLKHRFLHGTVLHVQHRANCMDDGGDANRGNHGLFCNSLLPQHVLMRVDTFTAPIYSGGGQTP